MPDIKKCTHRWIYERVLELSSDAVAARIAIHTPNAEVLLGIATLFGGDATRNATPEEAAFQRDSEDICASRCKQHADQ
jgi:hypothetical protein